MHQLSNAAKQGRRKQAKRYCTYNTAGLSGLQKTHMGILKPRKAGKMRRLQTKIAISKDTGLALKERTIDTTFNHILVFSHVQYTQLKAVLI